MTRTSRRRAAAALLCAWLPLSLVWAVVWPENPEDTKAVFASAAAHRGAWELAATLFAVAFLLAVPGLTAFLGLVDGRRGGRLIFAGTMLGAAGFIGDVVAGSSSVMMSLLAAEPGRAQMVELWDRFGTRPVSVVFVALILLGHLGLVLLGVGLRRARLVRLWVPVAIAAGMVVETVAGTANHASVATVAFTGAGLIGAARPLLRRAPIGDGQTAVHGPVTAAASTAPEITDEYAPASPTTVL